MFLRSSSSGARCGQHAFGGQQRLQKSRGADQLDALVAQHLGHRAQQHVGIARAQVQAAAWPAASRGGCCEKICLCLTWPAITALVTPSL